MVHSPSVSSSQNWIGDSISAHAVLALADFNVAANRVFAGLNAPLTEHRRCFERGGAPTNFIAGLNAAVKRT